jgi:immune inhibitor A
VSISDVKDSHTVYRLWKDGAPGNEYFLVENRQQSRYDAKLPGKGLLLWHIDDAVADNTNEAHYKVALMQADGLRQLESAANRGDAGDPFPGSAGNTSFTNTSTPHSKAYSGLNSCVAVTAISSPAATMTAQLNVRCLTTKTGLGTKEVVKERVKERLKETSKEFLAEKNFLMDKRPEKPITDKQLSYDKPPIAEGGWDRWSWWDRASGARSGAEAAELAALESRIAALEAAVGMAEPFIGQALRPDLAQGALLEEEDLAHLNRQMAEGNPEAKRVYDAKPAER